MLRNRPIHYPIQRLSLFLLCILLGMPAFAQRKSVPAVHLRNKTIEVAANAQRWLDSTAVKGIKGDPVSVILVFSKLPDAAQRAALQQSGIGLKDYLSDNAYSALITSVKSQVNANARNLYAIYPMQPSWKVTPFGEQPLTGSQMTGVIVSCYPEVKAGELQAIVAAVGGKMMTSPLAAQHFYELSIRADKVLSLAAWYGIKTIGPVAHDQPLNYESQGSTKTNLAHSPVASGGYGLLGDGMTIGIGDNTSGVNHVDLRDRIINYNPTPYTNHGQHINGIAGGAGTMDPKGEGFAPHATILDHLYNLVWARTGTMVQDHNMTVTNNSYASQTGNCAFSGIYDAYSQALDTIALQYPNVLHVFASGNDGSMNCPPYSNGFGNVTGSYQPAKNVLVVSQSDKRYGWGINSSRGPVKDGRLKPEITAIGSDVYSTKGGDIYLSAGGTSMASPQVAGGGILLQQRYKQLHAGNNPTSDIIKALLMNGAMDIGNPGPDYTFGFGMMDMYRSLQMLDNNRYLRSTVANGGVNTSVITVPANTAQVKVMLYWHDAPASVSAATQLINDLDLEVADPSNTTWLPLVLDPTPTRVDSVAVPGVDHLNNVEQVTINNPTAGNYTVKVKGSVVPGVAPNFVVVYDFIPVGVQLSYPSTGAMAKDDDSMRVYWDASPDTRAFTLEFSSNNGGSWTTLNNNIPADRRYYNWVPTGISSSQCLMRLTRNGAGQSFTTGLFSLNPQPNLQLSAIQCPGYINLHWSAVPGATSYRVLRKKGPYLQTETSVTDTVYTFRGLSQDSVYYVAVQPMFNTLPGYRSLAVSRIPNTGTCAGNISDGDLTVETIVAPQTGRANTSSSLGTVNTILATIHNLDDAATNNYIVSWQINGGAWQSQTSTTPIPASARIQYPIPYGQSMATPGTYVIVVAVKNLATTDNVPQNDTTLKVVRQLANAPMNLATTFADGFEDSPPFQAIADSMGFTPNQHWDYYNSNDTGRLRTFVTDDIKISGNRSLSLDVLQYHAPITNFVTGTFNLSNYTAASSDELRFEFDYKVHGNSHYPDSNKVWARGSDTQPWIQLLAYDTAATPGSIYHSGSMSLNDLLIASGQNFSSSTQVRFGQRDTTVIALNDYGTGVTLDNVKLYRVQNDLAMEQILNPHGAACGLTGAPVIVTVHNGVNAVISNATISYRMDNGPVVTENLPAIPGKISSTRFFTTGLSNIPTGTHTLTVWVSAPGDTYNLNDTLTTIFRNEPMINTFPYLENFESNDGYWYAEGRNSSWQYGTPASLNVTNAASGTKAWKTNLTGYYNDNELSYLYSPCFSISTLTAPMLSFSAVLDIENCGTTLCDAAWIEYTTNNGGTWTKLGAYGQGYAWYTDSTRQIWNAQGNDRWRVRSVPLPVTSQPIRFRFVLNSDPGTGVEGIALDDIHIYNRDYGIYDSTSTGPVTQTLNGSSYISFVSNNKIIAQVNPNGQTPGTTDVNVYMHPSVDTASQQYYLQRSFMVNSLSQPADSITARFFVLDAEVDSLVNARGCSICSKPKDVYRLGISKYDDTIQANENGVLNDNINGVWTFYPKAKVKWVPYDIGYYAEVRVPSFSEFWFNDGGPQGNLSLPNYSLFHNTFITVYPNPTADGQLTLSWDAGLTKTIAVAVTNMMGQVVYNATLPSLNGRNKATLNVGAVAKGMYFLHCVIGENRYTQKVVFN